MDVAARLEAVENENDALRERIAQLETFLGVRTLAPLEFGFTSSEARAFGVLVTRDIATKDNIMFALYGSRWGEQAAEPKIVDVFICKARKKLKPFAVEIKTAWGRGYYLEAETKRRIQAMMMPQPGVAA